MACERSGGVWGLSRARTGPKPPHFRFFENLVTLSAPAHDWNPWKSMDFRSGKIENDRSRSSDGVGWTTAAYTG